MLTYQQAQELILSRAHSFGKEVIDISQAQGRVLAEPLIADRDYPPFNRSAMDGYALKFSDYESGIRDYQIVETIFAGQAHHTGISTGQCYKIMTGAAVPDGADMVMRREDVLEQNSTITLNVEGSSQFQHMSLQGEDLKAGEVVLAGSCICSPQVIGLLAALGRPGAAVERLPSVGLFTTGDEVVPPDKPVNAVQIRNSNRYLLSALLGNWNITPQIMEHIPDDRQRLHDAFKAAMDLDMMIISGAVSAGDADYVPEVLQSLGVKKHFHKLAIKPGKPIWCGESTSGCMVFALPGNPFSCQVTFVLFINAFLRASFGLPSGVAAELPILHSRTAKSNLDEFFPVRINRQALALETVYFNGSGDIRAGLHADGLALQPSGIKTVVAGSLVRFFPFGPE